MAYSSNAEWAGGPEARMPYHRACANAALYDMDNNTANTVAAILSDIYGVDPTVVSKDLKNHAQVIEDLSKPFTA